MRADYHVHTEFSDDSVCPMEDMVQKGIALGLNEIAFTEHVDYGVKTDDNCSYPEYFEKLGRMREQFGDKITLKTGIEFGVQRETVEEFNQAFAAHPFDFVILSNHQADGKMYYNGEYQPGKNQKQLNESYYEATLDVLNRYDHWSVLGHIDMIKRYDPLGTYADEKIMPIIDDILRCTIAKDKGIELNTSSFRYKLNDLTPSRAILRRYYDLGGRVLTIGSDAHETKNLHEQIDYARGELKKIGFTEFCTFTNMEPSFHPL